MPTTARLLLFGRAKLAANGFSVSIGGWQNEAENLRDIFNKLAKGGQATMPTTKQQWGDEFGMVTDKFGVSWMVSIRQEAQKI